MKHESAVQAVKELMRKDSVFRSVIQGWGVATLLIGIFMFYMGANTYIQSYKQTDWVFGSAYITDISELNRSKVGRGGINYSMTYEYEVDGTHYTGKYGPLATLSRWAGPSASNTIRAPRKTPPAFWRRVAMILPW